MQMTDKEEAGLGTLGDVDVNAAMEKVVVFARANPHAALAGAVAVGFVIGGGLSPRLLAGAAMILGRRMLTHAVRDGIEAALENYVGSMSAAEPDH
jgi:hypothetical protein